MLKKRRSIQGVLAIVIFLFSLFMTLAVTSLEMYSRYRDAVEDVQASFERTYHAHINSLGQNLWRYDERSTELQIVSILNDPSIIAVDVWDNQRGSRWHGDTIGTGSIISRIYPIMDPGGSNELGELRLYGSDRSVREQLIRSMPRVITAELLKLSLSALFLFMLFYKIVGRHLLKISRYAEQFSLETIRDPLYLDRGKSYRGGDELDVLVNSLNGMRTRIEESFLERIRIEEILREREEKLRNITENMTDVVYTTDLNLKTTYISPSIKRLLGYTPEEYLSLSVEERYTADSLSLLKEKISEELERESDPSADRDRSVIMEIEEFTADGVCLTMSNHAKFIRDESGNPIGFQGVQRDISDIKRARELIEDKNRELEQIVYVTSHDLRSPLVNVDGYSREIEYSLQEIKELLGSGEAEKMMMEEIPDMIDSISFIRKSTLQMDRLLKGLLRLSRSGRSSLNIVEIDMNEMAQQVVGTFDFQIKSIKDISINIDKLPPCCGDELQLSQVLSNLIGNSIKYRDPARELQINISGEIKGKDVVYTISDTAMGIAKEHQENVFELFHRLNPNVSEGDGLGLTIIRQSLMRMGGRVFLESEVGVGSSFYIVLPAVK